MYGILYLMDKREAAALDALIHSKKYSAVCPATVERVFLDALGRFASTKEADKAARAHLHQIAGAFMDGDKKKLSKCLLRARDGDEAALSDALALHASTRERKHARDLYERVFALTGRPHRVLDLACGLNPLVLGDMGIAVHGMDIHAHAVWAVNEWAQAKGWPARATLGDLLSTGDFAGSDLALFMKLLPVLEAQQRGSAMALVVRVPARHKLLTFPTRTLGGRQVGMEQHHSRWLENNLPASMRVIDRFIMDDELCYVTEDLLHG